MAQSTRPRARQTDLVIESAADELLIFDKRTDKAYVLSPAAAAVWRAADGTRTVQAIAAYLSRETPTTTETVWYALSQLSDLLQEPVTIPPALSGISRRKFLQRAGLVTAVAAVPVVVQILAPTAAHAQSTAFFVCCICNNGTHIPEESCTDCITACNADGGLANCEPLSSYII